MESTGLWFWSGFAPTSSPRGSNLELSASKRGPLWFVRDNKLTWSFPDHVTVAWKSACLKAFMSCSFQNHMFKKAECYRIKWVFSTYILTPFFSRGSNLFLHHLNCLPTASTGLHNADVWVKACWWCFYFEILPEPLCHFRVWLPGTPLCCVEIDAVYHRPRVEIDSTCISGGEAQMGASGATTLMDLNGGWCGGFIQSPVGVCCFCDHDSVWSLRYFLGVIVINVCQSPTHLEIRQAKAHFNQL